MELLYYGWYECIKDWPEIGMIKGHLYLMDGLTYENAFRFKRDDKKWYNIKDVPVDTILSYLSKTKKEPKKEKSSLTRKRKTAIRIIRGSGYIDDVSSCGYYNSEGCWEWYGELCDCWESYNTQKLQSVANKCLDD